mmetsp:Transcript_80816/g.252042  ORF Transcript_80816/g.252042 Transcript_80816/m.252042 type:complete len:289 (-) Transcript_80816:96-962(-)
MCDRNGRCILLALLAAVGLTLLSSQERLHCLPHPSAHLLDLDDTVAVRVDVFERLWREPVGDLRGQHRQPHVVAFPRHPPLALGVPLNLREEVEHEGPPLRLGKPVCAPLDLSRPCQDGLLLRDILLELGEDMAEVCFMPGRVGLDGRAHALEALDGVLQILDGRTRLVILRPQQLHPLLQLCVRGPEPLVFLLQARELGRQAPQLLHSCARERRGGRRHECKKLEFRQELRGSCVGEGPGQQTPEDNRHEREHSDLHVGGLGRRRLLLWGGARQQRVDLALLLRCQS